MAKDSYIHRMHSAYQTLMDIDGAVENWVKTTKLSSPTELCGTTLMLATPLFWMISSESWLLYSRHIPLSLSLNKPMECTSRAGSQENKSVPEGEVDGLDEYVFVARIRIGK
jgi:hypothetical protein